jgi:hypothetical protein
MSDSKLVAQPRQEVRQSIRQQAPNEYEATVAVTLEGLLIKIGNTANGVCFAGYKKLRSGDAGPAELQNAFRNVGDIFLEVDGTNCQGLSYDEVVSLLRDHGSRSSRRLVVRGIEVPL